MIHWKCDSPVKSSMGERARGWRRRDLEKNRMRAAKALSVLQIARHGRIGHTYAF